MDFEALQNALEKEHIAYDEIWSESPILTTRRVKFIEKLCKKLGYEITSCIWDYDTYVITLRKVGA